MKKRFKFFAVIVAITMASLAIMYSTMRNGDEEIKSFMGVESPPRIDPDYTSITVPPTIAPLNFVISEPGVRFFTDIYASRGTHIAIKSRQPVVQIPIKHWQKLLALNIGGEIHIAIYTKGTDGAWKRFAPITNAVSPDAVDDYLVYRLLPPLYTLYGKMGIYQRNCSTFEEKPLWLNRMSDNNCMNCHTFKNNNPDYMVAHMRSGPGKGTLIIQGGHAIKVNTETEFNKPAGFPAWHPNGTIIAFSVNTIRQFFHAVGDNREGFDKGSKIILYNIATNTVTTSPEVSSPDFMTTQPEWSPDGRHLYFCRAPQFPPDSISHYHTKILYDLLRISYSADRDTWGEPEMVLSHETTGLSVSFPRISPDGRFLLCCMMPYGTFPVFRPGGDLYLVNLQSEQYRKLEVNSDMPESFHSWSSNSRWVVFASKRTDGICARPYFSHVDSNGTATKPFLLPQKDPRFYSSFLKTYNLPELITKPISISPQNLVRDFYDNKHMHNAQLDPKVKERFALQKNTGVREKNPDETWRQPATH